MSRSLHRFAADDLAEAVRFYRKEAGIGVGRRFLDEFERVDTITYRVTAEEVRVLVVRHQRRDPDFGETRR